MVRKAKKVSKTTTNRGEFNRAYKANLEHCGKIHCSYCKYHRGENRKKWYGGFNHKSVNYPSWKLVSKNRKQWMKKPLIKRVEKSKYSNFEYVTFKW